VTGDTNLIGGLGTVTLLSSGKVLFTGNAVQAGVAPQLYDPASDSWSPTEPVEGDFLQNDAEDGLEYQTTTLLSSGKVLMAGGQRLAAPAIDPIWVLAAADLYDPITSSWTTAASMTMPRYNHTATLLPSGKVLVAGGRTGFVNGGIFGTSVADAELYDPATDTWVATGSMSVARFSPVATLMSNGKVLVVGTAFDQDGGLLQTADVYDPLAGTWSTTPWPSIGCVFNALTPLASGEVLGTSCDGSAILYDPATSRWTLTGPMVMARASYTATLLQSGKVLVVGPSQFTASTAELYDPASGMWSATSSLSSPLVWPLAVRLSSGKVLLADNSGAAVYTGPPPHLETAPVQAPPAATAAPAAEGCDSGGGESVPLLMLLAFPLLMSRKRRRLKQSVVCGSPGTALLARQ
jgi:hypothetical protein